MSRQRVGIPIGEAAGALGLNVDAVRKRIKRGTLDAYKQDDRWCVILPGVQDAPSSPAGSPVQPDLQGTGEPIEAVYTSVGDGPPLALVPLAAVADQLQGLADRLADLAERNEGLALEVGQLRERTATQQETIAELRRRAEAAEVERDALRSQDAPQPASEAPTQATAPAAPAPAGGFWQRLRRAFGGE
jgi:hypothetical protein